MTQPSLSSSTPANNATDVFLNKPISLVFNVALTSTSVTEQGILLVNVATDEILSSNIVYNSANNTVTLTPLSVLEEQTVYSVKIVGTDIALNPAYVVADSGGEKLITTIVVLFTTGTRVFIDDSSVDKDALNLSLEGDLNLPVHIKALGDFVIASTLPKNGSADVSLTLAGSNDIRIEFNKILSGQLCSGDWLTIDAYPLLDMNQYLAVGGVLNTGSIPSMTGLYCSGAWLIAGFASTLPNNVGIQVTIGETVTATDGSEFGPSEYLLQFSTDRYPKVSGVHYIKREIKAAADELTNDYIAALLFKNTIRHLSRYTAFDPANIKYSSLKWINAATIVDILDDQELEKALVAGTRRQLGDLNLSVDAIIGKLSLKHARALAEMEEADKTLFKIIAQKINNLRTSYFGDTPSRQWYGVNGKLIDCRFKYYQEDMPASNIDLNRQAKVPPAWF